MGVALRCSPGRPAAHLLQAARGVRRGASRDQLLSPPPLYSGSIRRDAAYAPCQSPASRSRGGLPGVGRQVCSGRNRRIDSRTRASGTGAADGRASGQTDGLADTGGWAGSARPGRRGRGGGAAARAEAAEGSAGGARPPPGGDPVPRRLEPASTEGRGWNLRKRCRSSRSRAEPGPAPAPARPSPTRLFGLLQLTCRSVRSQEGSWNYNFVRASGPADLWNPRWGTGVPEGSGKPPAALTAQSKGSVCATVPLGSAPWSPGPGPEVELL